MRGDVEDRTADFCEAQKGTCVLCWEEVGGKIRSVCGCNGRPLSRDKPLYKKLSFWLPEEYLQEQCAVKMLTTDVREG